MGGCGRKGDNAPFCGVYEQENVATQALKLVCSPWGQVKDRVGVRDGGCTVCLHNNEGRAIFVDRGLGDIGDIRIDSGGGLK